ncbi:cytochrome c [Photobacterium sp. SDRW27]|uniref:cytochrome c n=1 Tax=Photobacterium obscurum TaxID=2829490 RepID=UPI002243228D|nr:cytochrome c [Photobacterium obscurum]MCW8329113.1 cytochrome c [Photobacterium obscurum]
MKKTVLSLTLATTAFCGSAVAKEMPDPYTEAGPAIQVRQGIHQLMGATLMDAGAIATGKKEWNGFTLLNRVDGLAQVAQMYNAFFFVEGSFEQSNTVDDLLERKTEFQSQSKALQNATYGLRMAVRNHDPAASMKGFVSTIQACNACHQSFMKPGTEVILPLPAQDAAPAH